MNIVEKGLNWLERQKENAQRLKRMALVQVNALPYLRKCVFLNAPGYSGSFTPVADAKRAERIVDYLVYQGCLAESHIVVPRSASLAQLNMVHDFTYLSQLYETATMQRIFGQEVPEALIRSLVAQQRLMTGGTIKAARLATSAMPPKRIVNLGGGFHHAYPDGGYAFCVFNDIAVAVMHLRKNGFDKNILIIDLDLHQGDGNRVFFKNDPSVTTCSVQAESWDTSDAVADFDLALGPGISDKDYLDAVRDLIPKAIEASDPELVFYIAGVDVAEDDNIGDWSISHDAIFERDRFVDDCVGNRRMIVLTSGGYGPNAWRHSARFFAYLTTGIEKAIPSDNERLIKRIKNVAKSLRVRDLTRDKDVGEELDFGIEDLFDVQARNRFLDFYSPYGIECAAETLDILPHLRRRGFPNPHLEVDLAHPNGEAIRIFDNESKEYLLAELVVEKKTDANGYKLLWIEWLLLQDPTKTPSRPLLPGQQHPGLGCLHKVTGALFLICSRLHLDGVAFNPAFFHICNIAKGEGFFEDPLIQARFHVAQNLTAGMDLGEASVMLKDGINLDNGETFKWIPSPMVIPLSDRAKKHFKRSEYLRKVRKEAASLLSDLRHKGLKRSHSLEMPAVFVRN